MSSIDTINVLTLDISRTIIQTIRVKQYDANSRHILITVVDNGVAIDLNDYRVVFEAKTADNRSILNTCDIQEDGKALVVLTDNALYSSGKINAQLNIIASDSSLSTMPFYIQVVSSTVDPDEITPSNEFSALNDALIYVENIKNEFVLKSQMGVPTTEEVTGIATLDENGQVVEAQLPSYVDDILEGTAQNKQETQSGSYSATGFILTGEEEPCTPETGKIYMDTTDNIQYRWSGSVYISVGSHLGLGETSSTAYPGDRGKANADAIAALSTVAHTGSYNDLLDKPEHLGHSIKDTVNTYTDRSALRFEGKVSITDDAQNDQTKIHIGSDKFYNTYDDAYADIDNITEDDDVFVYEDSNTDISERLDKIKMNEADDYNPTKNYKVGEFCIYDNDFYRCISDVTKYTVAYIVGDTNLAFNWLSLTEGGTAISQSVGVADSNIYKIMTISDYYGKYYIWDENLGIYKETTIDLTFNPTKWVKDTIGNNLTRINTDLSNLSIKYDDTDDYIYCRVNGNWVRWRKANLHVSVVIYDAGYENPSYTFYSGVSSGSITRNAETIQFTRNSNSSQYWARTSASIDFTDITQLTIDTGSSSGPGITMIIGTQQGPIQWLNVVKDAGVHTFDVSGISGSYPITVFLHNGNTAAYCTLVLKSILLS